MNRANRAEKVLRHIDQDGHGIEIGPSFDPIAPKKEGYQVHTIDYMSREQLIAKYKDHPHVNVENIEEVDFVWHGEPYSELTGQSKYYDWIIAAHVIEHTPDLIKFIHDCDSILKDEGVISLAVPDKRYTFDRYRPLSGISKIIDSHFRQDRIHTAGTAAEYFLNVVSKAGNIVWDSATRGEYQFLHSLDLALQGMQVIVEENAYLDLHAWCFVPHSFRLIIHDLFCLGMIPVQEVEFFPTEGCEFYITLGRTGKGIDKTRLEMLDKIEYEMKEVSTRYLW